MRETIKCEAFRRQRGDFKEYLKGQGIDIGCGDSCLKVDEGTVRPWDLRDGDAQFMDGVPNEEYDFVYSSHCLEHMLDVRKALRNWIRILKPGGCLYFAVPDYILYEKMTWPSPLNKMHKQSFSFLIRREAVNRDNHYHIENDLAPLLSKLGADVLHCHLEDVGFDYNQGMKDHTAAEGLAQLCIICRKRVSKER